MKTHIITTFSFDELSEEAQEKALMKLWDINVDYDWHEFVMEDVKEIGGILGIDIDNIFYSGFSSQGDGACFTGEYNYRKGSLRDIRKNYPKEEELQEIALELYKLQRKHFYSVSAVVMHRGNYYHSGCTWFNVYRGDEYASEELEEETRDILRSFMDWIYGRLDLEYEYQTSEEAVKEMIIANEYEFTEEGKLY